VLVVDNQDQVCGHQGDEQAVDQQDRDDVESRDELGARELTAGQERR
jgi:hypothetical protein